MLTDAQCRNAICSTGAKHKRFADSGGLYLEVSAASSKRWFWKYRSDGKEGRLALGSYPAVGLTAARKARDAAKLQRAQGIDPVQARKVEKLKASASLAGDTFRVTALEWHDKQKAEWSQAYATRTLRQLERDLFPWLGARRLSEITPVELLAALRKIEERGALETADRGLTLAGQIWRYGVATGRAERDITGDLKGALTPHRSKHFAAITDPAKLAELLRAIQSYYGGAIVWAALQLAPLLFQRPSELRRAAWAEIDLDSALWTIPPARMKRRKDGKENGDPHLVPLPTQAVSVLRDLHQLTGHGALVFPGERDHDRPLSENALRVALLTMGYTSDVQTWHGFRATPAPCSLSA